MARPIILDDHICPVCGGNEFWDNRVSKKTPKSPDYKCADKDCKDEKGFSGGVWLTPLKKEPKKSAKVPAEIKNNHSTDSVMDALQIINNKLDVLIAGQKDVIKEDSSHDLDNGWDQSAV